MNAQSHESYLLADLALARRLERAEGCANAAFVETRASVFPESGAGWIEVAGAYAMFDGARSPVTQTFGLGLFQPVAAADLATIEEFFSERGAPTYHEISPLADPALLALLGERGYRPIEFTSVMHRPIHPGISAPLASNNNIEVRIVEECEREVWAQTAARGWSEAAELADSILEFARLAGARPGALCFLAELDGRPVAAAALELGDGVALLAGASTIPEARNRGAQRALLEGRLRSAAERGCDIAMMGALPGSASQRNAERQGFRIAYTRIKWRRERSGGQSRDS